MTSVRKLGISHNKTKPASSYSFISKLTRLNSLIIQQDYENYDGDFDKLDLNYLSPLTNLKELAILPVFNNIAIVDPITQLTN